LTKPPNPSPGSSATTRTRTQDQHIREFVPSEFAKVELPEVPPGDRYATLVSVTLRVDGESVGRFREMMAICEAN
jgi:hypothetical protein